MRRVACHVMGSVFMLLSMCSSTGKYVNLQKELERYVGDKDAAIGIAVIINDRDTISISGDRHFPMLSVYKFPIALAYAEWDNISSVNSPDSILVRKEDMHPDTYSPMRDEFEIEDSSRVALTDVMAYALQKSDNNASDLLIKQAGGIKNIQMALRHIGADGINVVSTEDEMHQDNSLCYQNSSTPKAMASLMNYFEKGYPDNKVSLNIRRYMETCTTGLDRLPKPLLNTGAVIGHKTGTGFILPDGRLMAVNDAGYVILPDGNSYSIAVFIENSGYSMPETEAIIAEISEIVYCSIYMRQ